METEREQQVFRVIRVSDGWAIEVAGGQVGAPRPTRALAVWAAENLARNQSDCRIVVQATDGSVAADYEAPSGRVDPPWTTQTA